jgi:hypothetical protein
VRVKATLAETTTTEEFSLTIIAPLGLEVARELGVVQGSKVSWDVKVKRQGFAGELEVRVEGLPEKVTCKPVPLSADVDTARLELEVANDAEVMEYRIKVKVTGTATSAEADVLLVILSQ